MTREELEHAIRAACEVSKDDELWVIGSQAILGQFPHAPAQLRTSIEVDIQPKNFPEAAIKIDGALGELSMFHDSFGFYIQGVSIEDAKLPADWQARVIRVQTPATRGGSGLCLEVHDLAASKLAAYRDKDKAFVRVLLVEDLVEPETLRARLCDLPVVDELKKRVLAWLTATNAEI